MFACSASFLSCMLRQVMSSCPAFKWCALLLLINNTSTPVGSQVIIQSLLLNVSCKNSWQEFHPSFHSVYDSNYDMIGDRQSNSTWKWKSLHQQHNRYCLRNITKRTQYLHLWYNAIISFSRVNIHLKYFSTSFSCQSEKFRCPNEFFRSPKQQLMPWFLHILH